MKQISEVKHRTASQLPFDGDHNPQSNERTLEKGEEKRVREKKKSPLKSKAESQSLPRKRSVLGFELLPSGGVVFTAYLKIPGDQESETGWRILRKKIERHLKGLERQFKCDIALSDKQSWFRATPVHELTILGGCFRDVLKCKSALPDIAQNLLITSEENSVNRLGYQIHML